MTIAATTGAPVKSGRKAAASMLEPIGDVTIGALTRVPNQLAPAPRLEPAILAQLSGYEHCGDDPAGAVRYVYAEADLHADHTPETLVYLLGRETCGSGGCTLLVLRAVPDGYALVSRISIVQAPVVVARTATKGWRDLVMLVAGGGLTPRRRKMPSHWLMVAVAAA